MFRRPRLLTVEDGMTMTMLVMFKVRCHCFVDDKNNIVVILLFLLLLIRLPLCDRPFISLLFDDLGTYCLFGADVTQTYKCLTMIIFVRGLLSSDYNSVKMQIFYPLPRAEC